MRCKACDKVLDESEILWRPTIEQWEDLCRNCRYIVFSYNDELNVESIGVDVILEPARMEDTGDVN